MKDSIPTGDSSLFIAVIYLEVSDTFLIHYTEVFQIFQGVNQNNK